MPHINGFQPNQLRRVYTNQQLSHNLKRGGQTFCAVVEKEGKCYSSASVAILALPGVVAFDLSAPIELFGRTHLPGGDPAYHVRACGPTDEIDACLFTLRVPWHLDILAEADTIILPGLADPTAPLPQDVRGAFGTCPERPANDPVPQNDGRSVARCYHAL